MHLPEAARIINSYKANGQIKTLYDSRKEIMLHKEILDKYEVLCLLQHGMAGDVLLVRHKGLSCRRVLKILQRKHPQYHALTKEARLLQRFRHPSIPIIYDICEYDTAAYLIEEFIEGESLKQFFLKQNCFSKEDLLTFSIQLCEILQYLHHPAHRVLHLDLKPENVLLSDGSLKLIDFGSAICRQEREHTEYFGTPGYLAPEQESGGVLTEQTDLYGLGRLMQFMLLHTNQQPGGYETIVRNCLRVGKKEYQSAEQVLKELRGIQHGRRKRRAAECWYAVVGIPTHYHGCAFALRLARSRQRHRRERVLVLDCNPEGILEQLERQDPSVCRMPGGFVYEWNGITIAKRVPPEEARGWRGRGYTTVICDFGNTSPELAGLLFTEIYYCGSMMAWTLPCWRKCLEAHTEGTKGVFVCTEGDTARMRREFGSEYEIRTYDRFPYDRLKKRS